MKHLCSGFGGGVEVEYKKHQDNLRIVHHMGVLVPPTDKYSYISLLKKVSGPQ